MFVVFKPVTLCVQRLLCDQPSLSKILVVRRNSNNNTHPLTENVGRKGTAIPLQFWTGPEGSRWLRLPCLKTTAHEGGKVVSPTGRPPLPSPQGTFWYSFLLEAESTQWGRKDYISDKFQWHDRGSKPRNVGKRMANNVPCNFKTFTCALHKTDFYFFGALVKLRKTNTSCVVCLSVRPHEATRLPLDGFSQNSIFEGFLLENLSNKSKFFLIFE